jgi:uncharacterized protein (UPF0297 family)
MNRTERKEIETQVREIICQMKEKIENQGYNLCVKIVSQPIVLIDGYLKKLWQ